MIQGRDKMLNGNTLKGSLGKLAVLAAVVCFISFGSAEQASAQRCGTFYGGSYRPAYYNAHRYSGNVGRYYRGNGVRVNVGRVSLSFGNTGYYRPRHTWHNTSHWDYHPTRHVWHGNHYDVIPGHYRYHRTGHWHHNHR